MSGEPAAPVGGGGPSGSLRWPRAARLVKRSEFKQVYSKGKRWSGPLFVAFTLAIPGPSRAGFTVPKALGKAVVRNRIRRRVREAVRRGWLAMPPGFEIVFNPRRAVLKAPFADLEREACRLFRSLAPRSAQQP